MNQSLSVVFATILLAAIYSASFYNYLLFHTLAEFFSAVIACGVFMVAWNTRHLVNLPYLLLLGVAYLFVGILDLVHTLSYSGMNIIPGAAPNGPTQLWIAARYMESLTLLIAPLLLQRRLRPGWCFLCYATATTLVLCSIFVWPFFPDCFLPGSGLTPFKIVSEYIICFILLAAAIVLLRRREHFQKRFLQRILASIVLTILSELAFTSYIHVFDSANLIGHLLKIVAFYLIYKAVIELGLTEPYDLLFRELHRERARFKATLTSMGDAVLVTDDAGDIVFLNPIAESLTGWTATEAMHQPISAVCHFVKEQTGEVAKPSFVSPPDSGRGEEIMDSLAIISRAGGRVPVEFSSAAMKENNGRILGQVAVLRDISERRRSERALREREELLQQFVKYAPAALAMFDRKMRYLFVSDRWLKDYGIVDRPIIGHSHYDIFPEITDRWKKIHRRGLLGEVVQAEEDAFLRSDGSRQWLRWVVRPWRTDYGAVGGLVIFTEDITYRKEAREVLERYELLAGHSRDIILFLDRQSGRILEANAAAASAYGYSHNELLTMHIADLRATETQRHTQTEMDTAFVEGIMFETVHRRKDGSQFPVEVSSQGAVISGQQTLISIVRNIAERKSAEQELRNSETKYRNLFQNMTEEVHFWQLIRDDSGRIKTWKLIDVNPPALKSWGFTSIVEIIGKSTDEIFGAGATEHYLPVVEKIMNEGLPHSFEDYFPNLDKYFRYTSVPLGDYFITTGADITEIKKAEKSLQESLYEKEVLLREIHHRVKNNMQVICSLVSLQANEMTNPVMRELFQEVIYRVRSMAMVHEKLYQSTDLARVNFADYTQSLLDYLWHAQGAGGKGFYLKTALEPIQLPVTEAVPCGLILNELLINSVKHAFVGRDHGQVTVALQHEKPDTLKLTLQDDGIGLPPNLELEKVSTLGLRLVQMLARQLRATVEVQSDEGTTFTIAFKLPQQK